MALDPVLLSRIQFGFTISFHIIFPSFTIGLSAYVAVLSVMALITGEDRYRRLASFWTKIFAVSFGMGVVSGIVLSYEIGTNWSRFSAIAGNVIGPMLGYEVLTAFFLESTFLGIMLFGANRVPPWLHAISAIAVAVGTLSSAFWILSANSFMQTPQGYEVRDGVAYPLDWVAIIFNPSFPYRLAHMVTAAYLTTGMVVLAVGARYLLGNRHLEESRTMMRMAIGLLAVLAPLQVFLGDQHGLNTLAHQPIKIAAIEAHWDGSQPAELVLFAWPDENAQTNRYAIAIPRLGSLILKHDIDGLFPGLTSVPPQDRPPVAAPFFAFRVMVGIGVLLLLIAYGGVYLWWRGRLFEERWYLWLISHAWWLGFVAVIAGWVTTEVGRQPWTVYGVLRTAESASPIPGSHVLATLIAFVVVYCIVFSGGIYYINRLIVTGPRGPLIEPPTSGTPAGPLSSTRRAGRDVLSHSAP
jgi:cytochrome bd ubiquinol oxidase subunit I